MSGFYLSERMMQLRVEEEHRQAELRRQRQHVRAGRGSWVARQRCRVLSSLGSLLVSSGQRLLQSVAPLPPSAEAA